MKLSNQEARLLGEQFARCLYSQGSNPVARGAVIAAKNDVVALIQPYRTCILVDQAFRAAMDALEPLQQGSWLKPQLPFCAYSYSFTDAGGAASNGSQT